MAGHSHWAGIKHKKALIDAKRGKVWSKLSKAIIIAAKMGGGDPDMNPRLRLAIDDAKAVSMPKENIQRALKRGTGEIEGAALEETLYEGYAAGGVAVICDVLTDNRNRTASELRKLFEISDAKLGGAGSVAWMFETKGFFLIPGDKVDEDKLMEVALEAGAEDVRRSGDKFEVICTPDVYQAVSAALNNAGITPEANEVTRMPKNTVEVNDADTARKVMKLMNRLDDHDDVQTVTANFNISDELMAQVDSEE
jgi:YebC/PmpR family DNA-binding regulatory protein